MEKKKAFIIVLLCTVILENVCEGSPVRSQFTKDLSYITATDRVVADVILEGMLKAHRRPPVVLTTLPTLEEGPDPPNSADHRTTDESISKSVSPEEVKLHPAKLPGKNRAAGRLKTLFGTQPTMEKVPRHTDSVHRKADQSQQTTPQGVKSHFAKMQGKRRGNVHSRLRALFAKLPPLEKASAPLDSEYQAADGHQQATQEEMKPHLAKLKGKHHDTGRLPTLLVTQPPLEETSDRPDSAYQAEDQFQTEEFSNKEQGSARGKREHSLPKDGPKVSRHVGRSTGQGTPTAIHIDTRVRPAVVKSSGIRWNVAHLHKSNDDNTRYKKKKKKKPHDPTASGSAIIVAGIAAGILVLLCVVAGLIQLCKKCRRRSRGDDDPEHGLATSRTKNGGESGLDKETVSERKATGYKKKASKKKSKGETKPSATPPSEQPNNYAGHASTAYAKLSEDTTSMHVSSTTGTPSAEVWIVSETSGSASSPASQTPMSQPSTWTPNETRPSTPGNAASGSSLISEWTAPRTANLTSTLRLPTATAPVENATNANETASERLETRSTPVISTTRPGDLNTTSVQSSGLAKNSGESVASSNTTESNASNSSTESCKTPVAPLNEVIITMEDDEEMKLVLVSSSECSSGELLYTSGDLGNQVAMAANGIVSGYENGNKSLNGSEYESSSGELIYTSDPTKTHATTDAAEMVTSSMKSSTDELPLPPPPMTPLRATTELKLGKAVGGRKAKENRLSIKHLSSGHYSCGFLGDLKMAVSKILTKNEGCMNENKEKRKVIKEQTKETGRSMKERIVLGKAIIMNEKVDNVRDQRCVSRRRVIHKALSPAPDSTLRPRPSLSQEIAFAQSVILPGCFHKKAMRKTKERCKVMKELVNEVKGSSFEDRLQIVASAINPDEEIRDANAKGHHKRSVIRMDSQMMKLRGKKSTFRSDLQFVRNVILGPPAIDHEKHPQMGCLCYHCKKHWAKTGGPPCLKSPSAIAISKDIVLIDGKLFLRKPKTAPDSTDCSNSPLNSYSLSIPSTSYQGPTSGSNGN